MKIKHFFSLAAVLAIALTGCTADEVVMSPDSVDTPITFKAYTGNMTRAAHSYKTKPDGIEEENETYAPTKFTVAAYSPANLQLFKDEVNFTTKDGNKWWYANETHYWPNGAVDFYAVIDEGLDNENKSKFTWILKEDNSAFINKVPDYEVKANVSEQLDFMYAVHKNCKSSDSNGQISLFFKHALSQICFKVENQTEETIDIYSITLGGIYGKGDFILPDVTTEGSSTTSGDAWSNQNTPTKYQIGDGKNKISSEDSYYPFTGYTSSSSGTTNFPKYAMNLIPQSVPASLANKPEDLNSTEKAGAYIIVQTKAFTEDVTTLTEDNSIFIQLPIDWQPGYRYIYNLIFNPGATKTIMTWNVSVQDFNPDNNEYIENEHASVKMRNKEGSTDALYLATCNLGATQPWEIGEYFWWGNTVGQKNASSYYLFNPSTTETHNQTWANLLSTYFSGTQNVTDSEGNTIATWANLKNTYDAAYQNWNKEWRMPTKSDLDWLLDENNVEWRPSSDATSNAGYIVWNTTNIGASKTKAYLKSGSDTEYVPGYYLKSMKTGGVIFLPATGYLSSDQEAIQDPSNLYYWSSSIKKEVTTTTGEDNTVTETDNGESKPYYLNSYIDEEESSTTKVGLKPKDSYVGMVIRPVLIKSN